MVCDSALVAAKLRRWEKYLNDFRLPRWEEIPDLGLYMEQVISLLQQYLDYLPPELKEEQFITASTINNYVRTKVMPEPLKKRYYRIHIAYLIMILTLKQSLSIALINRLIPRDLSQEKMEEVYRDFAARHSLAARFFVEQIRLAAAPILDHPITSEFIADKPEDLIVLSAVESGFSRLLAEKLLLLENTGENDGDEGKKEEKKKDARRDEK